MEELRIKREPDCRTANPQPLRVTKEAKRQNLCGGVWHRDEAPCSTQPSLGASEGSGGQSAGPHKDPFKRLRVLLSVLLMQPGALEQLTNTLASQQKLGEGPRQTHGLWVWLV